MCYQSLDWLRLVETRLVMTLQAIIPIQYTYVYSISKSNRFTSSFCFMIKMKQLVLTLLFHFDHKAK